MIRVSNYEMKKLRERFPGIQAVRTVHAYYVHEAPKTIAFLKSGCGAEVKSVHASRA